MVMLAPVRGTVQAEHDYVSAFTDESRPMGGFIPAETLVLVGTVGDNGTAGGTLYR